MSASVTMAPTTTGRCLAGSADASHCKTPNPISAPPAQRTQPAPMPEGSWLIWNCISGASKKLRP